MVGAGTHKPCEARPLRYSASRSILRLEIGRLEMVLARLGLWTVICLITLNVASGQTSIHQSSRLHEKADFFQQDLLRNHWLDGLYVSIVPVTSGKDRLEHTVHEPGNVIHAGVWTGRYLAGVGYQYAVTKDPSIRDHGGQILVALRRLQEVTGKPGLLARGYVKGHGPVLDYERDGRDSPEWHQGQGEYADYRWYGDVSVDNFNAILYGYAVYFDLAADPQQKAMIRHDVRRLMTHLLENHCRIVDVDGQVTRYGHVGIDPDPSRDEYYEKLYAGRIRYYGAKSIGQLPLRASLMLLPDLLIAHHITGDDAYARYYQKIIDRFKDNQESDRRIDDDEQRRLARTNHSSEGQAFEALYTLIRYERAPELLVLYRRWLLELWERNWHEGNALFTYQTLALAPDYRPPSQPGAARDVTSEVPNSAAGLRLSQETLARYPVDRVLRPVMNSLRSDIEQNPYSRAERPLSLRPLPIDQRPLDNEYAWKGNPYIMDGWLKPAVVAMVFSFDDPQVAWFCDNRGRVYRTLDEGKSWSDVSVGLMGASVHNIVASDRRTFVLWAQTNRGYRVTRDGGVSWREVNADQVPAMPNPDFGSWQVGPGAAEFAVQDNQLVKRLHGEAAQPAMEGWRIPVAGSMFLTPWGLVASSPGGCYRTEDGDTWIEMPLWREDRTGAADFLHAYWMGRYYGFISEGL